jgi:small-conductance mechanosensitive channel
LVRRPYDIGDRVEISNATDTMDTNGPSCGWIVEKVDLYTTTVRLGTTREVATFSNGSLAGSRIVNLKRSEKPNIYVYFKFGVDVSSLQIELFRKRITEYVKERPREWIRLVSFRCKRIEADLGFMEYVIIGQHREAWQNLPAIVQSKSDVLCFGLETQKELNMKYTAPHVPIDIHQTRDSLLGASSRFESSSRTDIFEDKKEK